MNIKQAKEQIRNAMTAYFSKNEYGDYCIPLRKQRPIFLYGAPGIGKTAIMEQVAAEAGVGLVSYSMTHHTRQSALGLPYLTDKEFEGMEYRETEYTMSEIIGSIYDLMRDTGVREGILFLDEINCVSETLFPSMLQFLQYKVFGQHQVPAGWIVVTAGNPPEYNKSVKDFDIVTWDRLKRIDVEPDFETWKAYALSQGVHPAVMTYLDARKKDFYLVESTIDGKRFVTPRGWDDLSAMIGLYERNGITVDADLISQYLQEPRIARDFAIYYDLFNKYRNDYQVDKILAGTVTDPVIMRAQAAPADERIAVLGLLFDAVSAPIHKVCLHEEVLDEATPLLKELHKEMETAHQTPAELVQKRIEALGEEIAKGRRSSALSTQEANVKQELILRLEGYRTAMVRDNLTDPEAAFAEVRSEFTQDVADLRSEADASKDELEHVFSFLERAWTEEEEILIFVTELTADYETARFIGHYGCDAYFLHNKQLQFEQRQKEILERAGNMDWEI